MDRKETVYAGDDVLEVIYHDKTWGQIRSARNRALDESDWRAVSDREISDEWREYRQLLRDLPQDWPGENGNDACDNFPIEPEE